MQAGGPSTHLICELGVHREADAGLQGLTQAFGNDYGGRYEPCLYWPRAATLRATCPRHGLMAPCCMQGAMPLP